MDIEQIKAEARIENQVRRRLQDVLSSGGMGSDGVAKEVLYWLPAEFIDWYRDLFLQALVLPNDSTDRRSRRSDRDSELGRTKVDEKEWKGKALAGGAGGRGKGRFNGEWIVKDEVALDKLRDVNQSLRDLVLGVMIHVDRHNWGVNGCKVGVIAERIMEKGRIRRVCEDCGKLMKVEYRRCPFHE